MDLAMPKRRRSTRSLKGRGAPAAIPIVALTGHALAGTPTAAREAGCDFVHHRACPTRLLAVRSSGCWLRDSSVCERSRGRRAPPGASSTPSRG